MSSARAEPITIAGDHDIHVSGLLQTPPQARACYVLAHGAGAGMRHPFMAAVAAGLAERGIATLRYQFPYMERGSKRPDPPHLAHATVRAAVAAARQALPGLALIAGGKSFGGRMTSQAQAARAAPGRARTGLPRLSATSGRQAVARARRASFRHSDPDAVSAGNPRYARHARPDRARLPGARGPRHAQVICGRRSFVPRAGAKRPQGCAGARRRARRARRLDRRNPQSPSASAIRPSAPTTMRHQTNSVKPLRET